MNKPNGTRIFVMVAVPVVLALGSWIGWNTVQAHRHEMNFGHMGMGERVKNIESVVVKNQGKLADAKDDRVQMKSDIRLILHKLWELESTP